MNRKIKLTVALSIFIAVSIIFPIPALCQGITLDIGESGGMGYSMFGSSFLNVKDFNSQLENYGYIPLSGTFFSVGGGGHAIINKKWIIGGEGHTLLGGNETNGNYTNSVIVSYGFFDLGYIIFYPGELRLYPLIGIGAGEMKFSISEDLNSISFDQILDTPCINSEISKSEFVVNFALGADYLISLAKTENERGGLVFGLRAGYCVSPFRGHWKMGDVEITGTPDLGFSGPYIRLMIGGGGFGIE
jgi:hypothetical protein